MSTGDNATSHAMHRRGGVVVRPQQQRILQACKQKADQYIEGLIRLVLDRLDEALISRDSKSEETTDDTDYLEAQQALVARRAEIVREFGEGFTRHYTERLRAGGNNSAAAKKSTGQSSGLSLVDENELEESLAVDGLVARARDRSRNELYALAQRFNALCEGSQYDEESQPLDPEVVSYGFRDVIHKMDLKVEVKLIAYKLFEQSSMQTLEQFYHQINSLLSDAGVLPSLRSSIPPRAAGPTAQQARSAESKDPLNDSAGLGMESDVSRGAAAANVHAGGEASSADVYQTLQKLMNARKYGESPEAGPAGDGDGGTGGGVSAAGSAALLTDDLVRGLSLLQHEIHATAGAATNVAAIKDALLGQMKQFGDGRDIHPAHDNTIDVIGMIFEFILDEPSIPDVVKNLLNQLQIPILKIALVDKEFFTNKNHSARRLLNVLGHASIGWNDNDEEARQRRFQKMEYIVNRVLDEFEGDPSIFAGLLGEFIDFLAKEDGGVAVEVEQPELYDKAPEEVQPDRLAFEVVEARLDGVEVPAVLRDFLRNSWREVLQHVLDHQGYDSEAWHRHEQMIDELMWSVEPKTTADERRKMVMLLPRLLDALREGMGWVGHSQAEIDALIDALEPIHMACLRGDKFQPVSDQPAALQQQDDAVPQAPAEALSTAEHSDDEGEAAPEAEEQVARTSEISDFERELLGFDSSFVQEDLEPPEEELGSIHDEFTDMAAEMTLGTWLEFDLSDKKKRGKLAWKSVVMGEYVFVDRKYKVVAERTLNELAADLRSGTASLVEDVAMFDRALDKVLNGLMSGSRATH